MKKIITRTILVMLFLGTVIYYWGRPLPINQREEVYPCTVYYRKVHLSPRIFIAHILTVDLTCENVEFIVTPPDKKKADLPLMARTTSEFAKEYGVQIAINGDAFNPWWSKGFFDYFPHKHDYVTSDGRSASKGATYGANNGIPIYISKQNEVSFVAPKGDVFNAISGRGWLLKNKQVVEDLNDQFTAPRTSIGVDSSGTKLILVIVDGRQPFYSDGVTIKEMADIMLEYGGENAINLDGGGSSTLVITDPGTGKVKVMNSPIDRFIPGNERYIANHLGIYIK